MAVTKYGSVIPRYLYRIPKGSSTSLTPLPRSGTFYSDTSVIEKPVTVGRSKPNDDPITLFINGTSRNGYIWRYHDDKAAFLSAGGSSLYDYYIDYSMAELRTATSPNIFSQTTRTLTDTTFMLASALNRLRNKAKDSKVNLAMMMAEYRQTANLFQSGAQLLVKATIAAVRKNPSILVRHFDRKPSKATAKAVLAYNYGVVPLAMDLHDAARAIREASLRDSFQFFRTKSQQVANRSQTKSAWCTYNGGGNYHVNTYEAEEKRVISVTALVKFKNELLLSTMGELGLTNPFALAYELIPFSFVVDWWFNVGDVLASLDNLLYFDWIKYQTTDRWYFRAYQDCEGYKAANNYFVYNRSAVGALSLTNSFQYKPSVSLKHIVNGMALITTNYERMFNEKPSSTMLHNVDKYRRRFS